MRTLSRTGTVSWALAAGLAVFAAKRMIQSQFSFCDKVVVITGGSRGLGLALARRLAKEGAHLALIARSRVELERATADLRPRGDGGLMMLPCDVRDETQVRHMIDAVADTFGRIDVLVNNAGEIMVGPLHTMTREDWEDCMDLHFWAPLFTMQAALPHMPKGVGRIINISSFGGKIAVPHMAPYCASKFALVGLSDAVRTELAMDGIKVTTVCPGLMRTGSHLNAMFKGDFRKEYAWFASGAGSPLNATEANSAARKIIEASRRGQRELTISMQARAAVIAQALFPNLFARAMQSMNRMLPQSAQSTEELSRHTGWQSRSMSAPRPLTSLADDATEELNGLRGHLGVR